jgi:hypothetical protein
VGPFSGRHSFVVGTLLIGFGLGPVFFSLTSLRKIVAPLTVLGVVASVVSFYLYSSALVSRRVVVPVVITVLVALFFLSRKTAGVVSNEAVFIGVLSVIVFSLQFLIYPSAYLAISAVGALLLAVMVAAYITVVGRGDRGRPPGRQS